jgi:ACS family hexuronate transporter-like MFS transporter
MPALIRPERSHFRWTGCALLFFATTFSYVDWKVLSMLAKTLESITGWNAIQYGNIIMDLSIAYGLGLLLSGRLLDKFGTLLVFTLAVGVWSIAAILHAGARSVFRFSVARIMLGLSEAANFLACIKTVAEWFPTRERGTATGIFNSGANIGAIGTILLIPWLTEKFGWRPPFLVTGGAGFIWVAAWPLFYRRPEGHSNVSAKELVLIRSGSPEKVEQVLLRNVFLKKETWAFWLGKFLTNPTWWFYLFWLPKYLQDTHHRPLKNIIWPMLMVYNVSTVGSAAGSWMSGKLISLGWSISAGRKTEMLI